MEQPISTWINNLSKLVNRLKGSLSYVGLQLGLASYPGSPPTESLGTRLGLALQDQQKVVGFPFLASRTSPSKALILQQEISDLTELYIGGVRTM